jgi:heme oxygenase
MTASSSAQPLMAAADAHSEAEPGSLWARLKAATREAHRRLDERVIAGRPFEDRQRYGLFLLMQHDFHRLVSPLYGREDLGLLLPNLADRDRLAAVEQDLRDLDITPNNETPAPVDLASLETAIGWLYVAEGSKLGAAFLLKAARPLGLSEGFGARHLAGAPEGRGLAWKSFTAGLDRLALSPDGISRAIAGAEAAFARAERLLHNRFDQADLSRSE